MTVLCHFGCGAAVDPHSQFTYTRVEGWERKAVDPKRRGGSDITLRERRPEFACTTCIERLRSGLSVGQEALL